LHSAWPQLTRGLGSNYPLPDADRVIKMAKQNPKVVHMTIISGSGFSGKPEEATAYAAQLQDVWRLMFRGDFAQAKVDSFKLGAGGQIADEPDALLKKSRNQTCALALYGGYQAGVTRKAGAFVGGMTYGVNSDKIEQLFAHSFTQADNLPIGHYEYASALTYVCGDAARDKTLEHLQLANQTTPNCAMDKLEVELAKNLITHMNLSSS
jgi:hypothetical protein